MSSTGSGVTIHFHVTYQPFCNFKQIFVNSTITPVELFPPMAEYFKLNMLKKLLKPVGKSCCFNDVIFCIIVSSICILSTAIGLNCSDGIVVVVEKVTV